MFRKTAEPKKHERIAWRSHEPSRLETFSDAVFAFALTLIIVSVEVPKTFTDLLAMMGGVVSFGICFAFLFNIWNMQNKFFRRYGLTDNLTITLNGILLFVSLIYVYPLKFLTSLIGANNYYIDGGKQIDRILPSQIAPLMIIYASGLCTIYLLFFLMYKNAQSHALQLKLTPIELFETKTHTNANLLAVGISLLCIVVSLLLPKGSAGSAGFIFFLLGPAYSFWFARRGKKARQMFGH